MKSNPAATPEPAPTGKGQLVIYKALEYLDDLFEYKLPEFAQYEYLKDAIEDDLEDRARMGNEKYGTYLRTNNGRNALNDAIQETYDLHMYMCQYNLETGKLATVMPKIAELMFIIKKELVEQK